MRQKGVVFGCVTRKNSKKPIFGLQYGAEVTGCSGGLKEERQSLEVQFSLRNGYGAMFAATQSVTRSPLDG